MRALVLVALLGSQAAARRAPAKPRPPRPTVDVCAVDVAPPATTKITTLADIPAERGTSPDIRYAFTLVEPARRATNAATLVAMFPAAWHAKVELDATGMANLVAFDLPGAQTPDQLSAALLAFVNAHRCLFGSHDVAEALAVHVSADDVIFDRKPHTIGSLAAHVTANTDGTTNVRFGGHLWPIPDRTLALNKHYIRRYLARTFEQVAGTVVRHPKTFDKDFRSDSAPVLRCYDRVVQLSDALVVELAGAPNGDPVLAELPTAIDPATGKPIPDGWIAPVFGTPDGSRAADRMNDAGRQCLGL